MPEDQNTITNLHY